MAKFCMNCGKKMSFLSKGTLCKECKKTIELKLTNVVTKIQKPTDVTDEHLAFLKKSASMLPKNQLIQTYSKIYDKFESDNELEEVEINTLGKIQTASNLTDHEVQFDDRVRPYVYVNLIRKGELPTVNIQVEGGAGVVMKKGEIVHFAESSVLKEMKSVSLGYRGGSRGVSVRVAKGVRFRVGAHKGHIEKEQRWLDTSRGTLILSNQRLFLHPFPGNKPVSIPLKKVLSYHCYSNGLELYKEGREKGYFFAMDRSSSVEILGLCLGHLLSQN